MNNFIQKVVGYSYQAIFIFSIFLAGFYYFTMYDDGSKLQADLEKTNNDLKAEEVKKKDTETTLKEESTIRFRVKELGEHYEILSKKIPSSLNSSEINKLINDAAKVCGAKLKTFHPEANLRKGILEELPTTVVLEGTFSQIAQFIYQISTTERIMSIKEFSLVPVNETNRVILEGVVTGYKLAEIEKSATTAVPADASGAKGQGK